MIKANSGIYEIENLVTGKRYIGSAVNFGRRFKQHKNQLSRGRHHCSHLQRSWLTYGGECFEFRPIMTCQPSELLVWEQCAMDLMKPEYNSSPTAGNILGLRWSCEKRRGVKRNRESVEKSASAHRGMKRSKETRARISAALSGKKRAPRSDEHRAKLSKALTGKPKSADQIEKMRATKRGMKLSNEHKFKIGLGSRAAWARRRAAENKESSK